MFFVQTFMRKKRDAMVANPPQPCSGADVARRSAERLSQLRDAVLAYSIVCDPDLGEFDRPTVLAEYGDIPERVRDALAA